MPTDATDQDTGYLTGQLEDASGYSALLGHRALLTEDLGSGPATILDGVIKSAKLLDTFSSFELELRDIRERERNATAFTNTPPPTVFPRGALDGFGALRSHTFLFGGSVTYRYPLPPTRSTRQHRLCVWLFLKNPRMGSMGTEGRPGCAAEIAR